MWTRPGIHNHSVWTLVKELVGKRMEGRACGHCTDNGGLLLQWGRHQAKTKVIILLNPC